MKFNINDWENPQVVGINKLQAHATGAPFADQASALKRDPSASPWLRDLNGEWDFILVANPDVDVISFTGSTAVGRRIASIAGERLAKVSLELGGKNPLIVCDDADLESAVDWTLLAAFSFRPCSAFVSASCSQRCRSPRTRARIATL